MDEIVHRLSQSLNQATLASSNPDGIDFAAAVLILLVKDSDEWKIVYTRRTKNVRTHQGEVSFPGGAYEPQDENTVQTALRETYEEIGINPDCITIIGGLEPIRTISNFVVYPYVGVMECLPDFVINLDEVERIFLIPLDWLTNPDNFYEQDHMVENQFFHKVIHYRDFEGEHLWGLTARITQQLLKISK
ncbi:MAG: hypothetical protein CVU43_02120 [Chloroflexi bacterium HGW-Chloroflexi-5]|jgi:8-oxo-dGTP pyrophosphatase MutT (NUDIX family)|nr:MAG: hypothetical protein CVU43_02120 [Chloroflexi bacterium HGW-Chloroflexi-5]